MEFMALNDNSLLEICLFLKNEDLLFMSKIVCRRLDWNQHLHAVERVRCYRLQNVWDGRKKEIQPREDGIGTGK